MIVVICYILTITIKDLVVEWNNKKLATKKSAIWFEPVSQKKAINI